MFISFMHGIYRPLRSGLGARHLLLGLVLGLVPLHAAADDEWSLFGSNETRYDEIDTFRKWTGMLERYPNEQRQQQSLCSQEGRRAACVLTGWMQNLENMRRLSKRAQIDAVNAQMNAMPYTEDIVNWGMEDYWETPFEFLRRSGDCEDYAISKYKSLRLLGFPAEDLRIIVLNDLNLGVLHAVLGVHYDGQFLILDNQITQAVESKRIFHYQPIYSINEEYWWRHQPKLGGR